MTTSEDRSVMSRKSALSVGYENGAADRCHALRFKSSASRLRMSARVQCGARRRGQTRVQRDRRAAEPGVPSSAAFEPLQTGEPCRPVGVGNAVAGRCIVDQEWHQATCTLPIGGRERKGLQLDIDQARLLHQSFEIAAHARMGNTREMMSENAGREGLVFDRGDQGTPVGLQRYDPAAGTGRARELPHGGSRVYGVQQQALAASGIEGLAFERQGRGIADREIQWEAGHHALASEVDHPRAEIDPDDHACGPRVSSQSLRIVAASTAGIEHPIAGFEPKRIESACPPFHHEGVVRQVVEVTGKLTALPGCVDASELSCLKSHNTAEIWRTEGCYSV